jgi:hypothetical protein
MKIVICGGRSYGEARDEASGELTPKALREREKLRRALDSWRWHFTPKGEALALACGGCPSGADMLAREWARDSGLELTVFEADWKRYGAIAGPLRNKQMLDDFQPDFLLAFPGGAGTYDCTRAAKLRRIPVILISKV